MLRLFVESVEGGYINLCWHGCQARSNMKHFVEIFPSYSSGEPCKSLKSNSMTFADVPCGSCKSSGP